jgi:hypothetical protein
MSVFDQDDREQIKPSPEPAEEPTDGHRTIPLDRDEDGRWLEVGDPRRTEAERRLGRKFEED